MVSDDTEGQVDKEQLKKRCGEEDSTKGGFQIAIIMNPEIWSNLTPSSQGPSFHLKYLLHTWTSRRR